MSFDEKAEREKICKIEIQKVLYKYTCDIAAEVTLTTSGRLPIVKWSVMAYNLDDRSAKISGRSMPSHGD